MASWSDYFSLLLTLSLIGAVIYGVIFLNDQVRKMTHATREKLHDRGVDISNHGVSLKTHSKLASREEYFDATQRGFIKAFNAASGGNSAKTSPNMAAQAQTLKRRSSADSLSAKSSGWHHRKSDASVH